MAGGEPACSSVLTAQAAGWLSPPKALARKRLAAAASPFSRQKEVYRSIVAQHGLYEVLEEYGFEGRVFMHVVSSTCQAEPRPTCWAVSGFKTAQLWSAQRILSP